MDLSGLGLSANESKVFMCCLKAGSCSASRLAELTGFARTTVYGLLQRLEKIGFISSFVMDGRTVFSANEPDVTLAKLIEHKEELASELAGKISAFRLLAPELEKHRRQIGSRPVVEILGGTVGVSRALEEMSEKPGRLMIIGSQQNAVKIIGYRADRFRTKRKEHNCRVRQILEDSAEARKESSDRYTEIRFLKSLSAAKEAVFIQDDTTVYLILTAEPLAVRIRSREHTQTQKILFQELWQKARK